VGIVPAASAIAVVYVPRAWIRRKMTSNDA
jgi:hypothetical protein